MMRVMVIVKATENDTKGMPPKPAEMEAMQKYQEALAEAGVVVTDGAGLTNTAHSHRVTFDGSSVEITQGPFAENRNLIVGYSVWEVTDMDAALTWAKRWPFPASGHSEIEMRRLFEWQPADDTYSVKTL